VEVVRVAKTLAQELVDITIDIQTEWTKRHATRERSAWSDSCKTILKFLAFAQSCKVVIRKPKILRSGENLQTVHHDDWSGFCHKNRFIVPQVFLVSGETEYRVERLNSIRTNHVKYEFASNGTIKAVQVVLMPDMLKEKFGLPFLFPLSQVPSSSRWEKKMALAFAREAGANWQNVKQQVADEWAYVESHVNHIYNTEFGKTSAKERKTFRIKFTKTLAQTRGLVEAPPEAILALFQLGWQEIKALQSFTKRNAADIGVATLDDIVDSQNEARVQIVMES
jgi:hypothetical protein